MKPAYIQPGMCSEYVVGHNDKDPKFKVGDHVRISKYKNISQSFLQIFCYTSNWSEEVAVIKKLRITIP